MVALMSSRTLCILTWVLFYGFESPVTAWCRIAKFWRMSLEQNFSRTHPGMFDTQRHSETWFLLAAWPQQITGSLSSDFSGYTTGQQLIRATITVKHREKTFSTSCSWFSSCHHLTISTLGWFKDRHIQQNWTDLRMSFWLFPPTTTTTSSKASISNDLHTIYHSQF